MTLSVAALVLVLPLSLVAGLYVPLRADARSWRSVSRYGYVDGENPYKTWVSAWFGEADYIVRRDDGQRHRGHVTSKNPYSINSAQTQKNQRQRTGACDVCGHSIEESASREYSGPFFEEEWRATVLVGLPFRRRYVGCRAYCHQHKPKNWPSENR